MSSKDPETLRTATTLEKQALVEDDTSTSDQNVEKDASVWQDAQDTVGLAAPMFLSMLSWVGMKTTDSALLGHVSADALAAAALSDLVRTHKNRGARGLRYKQYPLLHIRTLNLSSSLLPTKWTMCTFVLVGTRVLGVLCSTAIGAGNPKLAGIYLQVSYLVLSFAVLFVVVCWSATEQVWTLFGSDAKLAHMAGFYARVMGFSLPGQVALDQLGQFFSSQRIMHPEVNASSTALILNVLLGLVLVLGIPIPGWDGLGFAACPMVTVSVVYMQFLIMYLIYVRRQRLHEACWDGWSWQEITATRVRAFLELYVPSALGDSSDFWRVAVIGAVAAKLGDIEVAVFNTGYRIMWIVLVLIGALSSAAGIITSQRLGQMNHLGAKQAGWVGIYLSMAVLSVIGTFVLWKIRWFGRIFTEDDKFLDLFEEARVPFTLALVLMNLSVAIERIPFSMGRSREVFWYGFVASWGAQVPGVVVLTTYWRKDLVGLYWGMAIGYGVLTVLYGWMVFISDWKQYAILARKRSEMPDEQNVKT
jgi:multidrug resistance protein, MATE family